MVYRVPEILEKDGKKRKDEETSKINDLLKVLEVKTKPQKSGRVGNFTTPNEGEQPKCRPLKLVFNNHSEAKKVVENSIKLKNSDEMKGYSLDYDASKEQRDNIRKLVAEAREKTSNSPNLVFKVRGPPWNAQIKEIRAPAATEETNNPANTPES